MPELYQGIRAANSRFVPQFVGSNFNELKDLGDTLDQRYRTNRDLSDKLAIELANDEVHPLDQPIIDNLKKNLYGTLDEVAKSPENFENSTGIIANEARKIFTDRGRIHSIENMKKYNEYLDLKAKAGRDAVDFTKPFVGTFNSDGSINRFQHRLEKRLDYDKQKEQYANQMEANLIQSGYAKGPDGVLRSSIEGGLTKEKIRGYLPAAISRHITTGEYSQEKEDLITNQGYTPEAADAKISESILNTMYERANVKHLEEVHNPLKGSGEGGGASDRPTYEETPGQEYKPTLIPLHKLQGVTQGQNKMQAAGNAMQGARPIVQTVIKPADKRVEDLSSEEKKIFKRIALHINPQADKNYFNSEEAFDAVGKYIEEANKLEVNEKTPIITTDFVRQGEKGRSTREDATKDLASAYKFRTFYNVRTGKKLSGSSPTFLKDMGYENSSNRSAHEQFKSDLAVVGEYSPKNMFTDSRFADSEAFSDPLAVDVNGETYAVSRPISEQNDAVGQTRKIVNKAYKALKQIPGIPNDLELDGHQGIIGETAVGDKAGYVWETRDGKHRVFVENLEDLPMALKREFSR